MRVVCISDLHGYLPKLKESGELLLICGDISPLNIQFKMDAMQNWIETVFTNWLNSLDFKKILFIAGNHDVWFERNRNLLYEMFPKSNKATYLCNNLYEHISEEGKIYRIFGTPYCHIFGKWPFMRTDEILTKKYNEISENLDILIGKRKQSLPLKYEDIVYDESRITTELSRFREAIYELKNINKNLRLDWQLNYNFEF